MRVAMVSRRGDRSYLAGCGVGMNCQTPEIEEVRFAWRLAPVIGLLAGLAPAVAHAQTNIDQGKSPAQIFADDCAACHKAARGLANGKGSYALTEFLHEHYTTSRDQAAALAAYVLGAGRGQQQPAADRAGAMRKPEEGSPGTARLQRPGAGETKPHDDSIAVEEPGRGRRGADRRHDGRPITATRGHRNEPETPPLTQEPAAATAHEPTSGASEPAAVVATPAATESPGQESSPTPSAAPTDSASGDSEPVPRDNIPD